MPERKRARARHPHVARKRDVARETVGRLRCARDHREERLSREGAAAPLHALADALAMKEVEIELKW